MERSVRAVGVVVREVFLQHRREVARCGDEEVVEAFAVQGADEALGDRVRSRCSNRGADDADVGAGEHPVDGGGEPGIPPRIKNRNRRVWSPRSIRRLRACWVTRAAVGWAVIPARCTRRVPCSITMSG
jgi:hypothetical protein